MIDVSEQPIEAAAEIRDSGRWKRVNEAIARLAAHPGERGGADGRQRRADRANADGVPGRSVLRTVDRIEPLAKLAAMT